MPTEDLDLPAEWKNYPDGSILRLEFHNFLTYEYTVCKPGENLNLILGHNGSGKSSIICGICLVFGGSPKSLGRSERLAEYIRFGGTESHVEAIIADKTKGPQVLRLVLREGKSPEYRLNDRITTQHEIKELSKSYNIQIDNPCAFLAQDKVKSFSEQSPVELLFNTEKAASDELYTKHQQLIQHRMDSCQIEDKCSTAEKAVKSIEADIALLEPRVENYRKKKQMMTKLKLLEQRKAILEYEEIDKEYQEVTKKMDEASEDFDSCQQKVDKAYDDVKRAKQQGRLTYETIHDKKSKARNILESARQVMDENVIKNKIEEAKRKVEKKRQQFEQVENDKNEVEANIDTLIEKMKDAEADLEGYQEEMEKIKKEDEKYRKMDMELRNDEDERNKKAYDLNTIKDKQRQKFQEKRDAENRRLNEVMKFSRDAATAWAFYTHNFNQFRDEVYVPMIHMVLKTQDAARCIENSIGARDWCIFVCSNKDDEKLLHSSGAKINTTVVRRELVNKDVIDAKLPDDLRQIGFQRFVSESFDAPDALKQYLCNVAGISRIPVGGAEIERDLGKVAEELKQTRYSVFMSANIRSQIIVSKYSGEVSQHQSQLRQPRTWNEQCFSRALPKMDENSEKAEMEEIQKEIQKIEADIRRKRGEIQKGRDVTKQKAAALRNRKNILMAVKNNIEREKDKLKMLEEEDVGLETEEKELEKVQESAIGAAKKMVERVVGMQKEALKISEEIGQYALFETYWKKKYVKAEEDVEKVREKLEESRDIKAGIERNLQEQLTKKRAVVNVLKEKCGLRTLNEGKMDLQEKEMLKKIRAMFVEGHVPDDLEIVEKQIVSERTRLRMVEESTDGTAEDERKMEVAQKRLVEEISKREKLLETKGTIHEKLKEDIEEWKEKVEGMIERINESYREAFLKLNCLGEVHLEVAENELDIEQYGIMIMVSFRNGEKLKRLDQKVQSGGERSVSTMLYLLALQQLCPVPFRCVDEINQGMDPTNERKVFEIMVDLWSGDGILAKSQYFLLTPKLLHNLSMNERVTVLCVHSAVPRVFTNWNTEKYIEATVESIAAH